MNINMQEDERKVKKKINFNYKIKKLASLLLFSFIRYIVQYFIIQ